MSLVTVTKGLTMSAALLALSTGLAAAAPAVAETDLNVRAGPGIGFEVIGAIPAGATVDVRGCRGSWCRVDFAGVPGFASRDFLALGGPAIGRTVVGEGYYGRGYYAGYEPGYRSYGYEPGPGYAYETRGYGSYGEFRGERSERIGARAEGGERFSSRETRGERLGVGEERGERFSSREQRGERLGARAERSETQRANVIGGNNPMKNPKNEAPAAREGQSGQAAAIGGNNPMKNERSTSNPNLSRSQGQAAAIGGNNPMKNEKSTAAGSSNATTGAAPRERRENR